LLIFGEIGPLKVPIASELSIFFSKFLRFTLFDHSFPPSPNSEHYNHCSNTMLKQYVAFAHEKSLGLSNEVVTKATYLVI